MARNVEITVYVLDIDGQILKVNTAFVSYLANINSFVARHNN